MSYYFNKVLKNRNFDEAIEQVKTELKKEGFGVLTEIDVKETLKKKINVDFKKYKILGACHPKSAYEALQNEDKMGVFLPCNVIVEEHDNGEVEVSAVDPIASLISIKNESIGEIAKGIQKKLIMVIKNLK
ncbi:MAG: DUF302 domain-containing protein [Bacteroidales bacterium]|nr:DUF302 domain-containing protein [Bacteroidales bacterium]